MTAKGSALRAVKSHQRMTQAAAPEAETTTVEIARS